MLAGLASVLLRFQSTHPVRGATFACRVGERLVEISIHAPREGCDLCNATEPPARAVFQSTHPVRGATTAVGTGISPCRFQSTHPVRGATFRRRFWPMLY